MQLSEVMKMLDYRVIDSAPYQWKCFGPNARYLDFKSDHATGSVIFDTETQVIYEATIEPSVMKDHDGPYRWVNEKHSDALFREAHERGVDNDCAWDDVKWINLDDSGDYLEKAKAIFDNLPYDRRIIVNIRMPDDKWLALAFEAHTRGITMNAMVNHILRRAVREADRALKGKSKRTK